MQIALLGAAPSSRLLAPFQDPNWEIWACSPPNYNLPRVDAWFELHSLKRKMNKGNQPFFDVLVRHPRVYINRADPDANKLPDTIAFPFDDMRREFGDWFFTSSLAWMMALAITKKPAAIGLWGIDMSAAEEYGYQRAGMHYFIQEADKRGIQVIAPAESDILNPPPLYGLKEQSPMWWKQRTRRKELEQRVAECENTGNQKLSEARLLRGALDDMNYIENTYCPTRFAWNPSPCSSSTPKNETPSASKTMDSSLEKSNVLELKPLSKSDQESPPSP